MSIATKLQKILDSKAAIKTAIAGKGGTITDATPLDEYAQAVNSIPSGSDEDLIGVIENSIITLDIPSGTTGIGESKFVGCTTLISITIPDSVSSIGSSAFSRCSNLVSVGKLGSITSVPYYGFYNCVKLADIELPNTVTEISGNAFWNCRGLSQITLPTSLLIIGNSAYRGAAAATSLVIPDSVTTIGNDAFRTNKIVDLVIGSGITSIGTYAFADNSATGANLVVRIYATTPPTIGTGAFHAVISGIYVPDASVNDYKTATNWSTWASYIYPLSEYQP